MTVKSHAIPYVIAMLILTSISHHASAGWFDRLKQAGSELLGKDTDKVVEQIGQAANGQLPTTEELNQAFKQALDLGSQRVVDQLGQENGFNQDPTIRIPLPEKMQTVKKWLDKAGLGDSMDSFEVSLNRAAEAAMPEAKTLFIDTIKAMSFEDVKSIYQGDDDAATRYFEEKMTPALSTKMAPVVQQSLSDVGAVKLYDQIMGDYATLPFVPDVKANLVSHVVDGGLAGIFHYLAQEEAEIRKNPVKRTTELLKKVFGAQ